MVLSKLIYNAFKFIIQPAHELDICVPEHILGFPGFSQQAVLTRHSFVNRRIADATNSLFYENSILIKRFTKYITYNTGAAYKERGAAYASPHQ